MILFVISALGGATEINTSFEVVPEVLKDNLVKESLESTVPMILIVKRPDFLGDSRWEFRHGKQPIDAKLIDATWITEFRNGNHCTSAGRRMAGYGAINSEIRI
jgi:hypothetical protein